MLSQSDRLGHGAGDTAHLVTMLDENLFRHICDHQVVFGNQDLEHTVLWLGDPSHLRSPRKKDPEGAGLGPKSTPMAPIPSLLSAMNISYRCPLDIIQPLGCMICSLSESPGLLADFRRS